MDFRAVTDDVVMRVFEDIEFILSLSFSPYEKEAQIAEVLSGVGRAYADQMFEATSEIFDSTAIQTKISIDEDRQIARLSRKIVRDNVFIADYDPTVKEYFSTLYERAASSAFQNAGSMEKHPTVRRSMVGETCDWCQKLAGTYTDFGEERDMFKRHAGCDCLIVVSGYNSRNGVLKNYVKKKG